MSAEVRGILLALSLLFFSVPMLLRKRTETKRNGLVYSKHLLYHSLKIPLESPFSLATDFHYKVIFIGQVAHCGFLGRNGPLQFICFSSEPEQTLLVWTFTKLKWSNRIGSLRWFILLLEYENFTRLSALLLKPI